MNRYRKTKSINSIHSEITKDKDLKCLGTPSETFLSVSVKMDYSKGKVRMK